MKIPVGGIAPGVVQTLYQLQDLTRRTGMLHEVQTRHLKVWGMAALNVDKIEIRFMREPETVEFWTGSKYLHEGNPPANLTECLEYLDSLVRFLLGSEYRVIVVFDDDPVWDRLGNEECQTNLLAPPPTSPNQNVKS